MSDNKAAKRELKVTVERNVRAEFTIQVSEEDYYRMQDDGDVINEIWQQMLDALAREQNNAVCDYELVDEYGHAVVPGLGSSDPDL